MLFQSAALYIPFGPLKDPKGPLVSLTSLRQTYLARDADGTREMQVALAMGMVLAWIF